MKISITLTREQAREIASFLVSNPTAQEVPINIEVAETCESCNSCNTEDWLETEEERIIREEAEEARRFFSEL